MQLLQAGMRVFNGDSMQDYLSRCWRIVNGKANSKDLDFCTIRACKSHLMKQASQICKQQYIQRDQKYRLAMFIFSILVNAKTLNQVSAIVHAACIILGSKRNSCKVEESLATILSESQTLTSKEDDVSTERQQQDDADDLFDISKHDLSKSPFKDYFEETKVDAYRDIQNSIGTGKNNYYGEKNCFKQTVYIPTIYSNLVRSPLW